MNPRLPLLALTLATVIPTLASGQTINQSQGVDSRVNYESLTRIGPWDDRNYALTREDLALLAENEQDLDQPIPVFYRVEMRKTMPGLPRSGPVQYPHSALPMYLAIHGGYKVGDRFYSRVEFRDDRFHVLTDSKNVEAKTSTEAIKRFLEGESRVSSPTYAAESAVAISPVNPDIVVAGSNGPGFQQTMHVSADGGETWSRSENEGVLPLGQTCCDPTVGWSSDGTKVYAAALGTTGPRVWFYRSADGGQSWDDLSTVDKDPRRELGGTGADKEFLHVDVAPQSPYRDSIYLTWQENFVLQFAKSTDFGHTWSTPFAFESSDDQLGIGSDITTDSAGNIYVFWAARDSRRILVRKSTDGGETFAPAVAVASTEGSFSVPIPSQENRRAAIICSADADLSSGPFGGAIYAAWTDAVPNTNNHARVQVAYSRDAGATWMVTTPHEIADAEEVDRWQPWLKLAPDGSVHVIFNDTRNDSTRRSIDLFHNASTDGGQTWGTPERLTSETSPHLEELIQFGDYSGLDIVMNNAIAVFSDNRNESGGDADSADIYAIGFQVTSDQQIFSDGFETGDTDGWN